MPSFLGKYSNSANNREQKIIRAINSVLEQSFEDWELIIISDGCEKTNRIVEPLVYEHLPKIRLLNIPKQKLWSGAVRNAGIFKAEGEIICYLDTDDILGSDHLKIINDNFGNSDWVFFNDIKWDKLKNAFRENHCNMTVKGQCGTSNVAHRRDMEAYWQDSSYLHDFFFIHSLINKSKNFKVIPCGQYHIMHIPVGKEKYDL